MPRPPSSYFHPHPFCEPDLHFEYHGFWKIKGVIEVGEWVLEVVLKVRAHFEMKRLFARTFRTPITFSENVIEVRVPKPSVANDAPPFYFQNPGHGPDKTVKNLAVD